MFNSIAAYYSPVYLILVAIFSLRIVRKYKRNYGIRNYGERTCKAYYPEAGREFRALQLVTVEPLIHKSQCEKYLSEGAVNKQP